MFDIGSACTVVQIRSIVLCTLLVSELQWSVRRTRVLSEGGSCCPTSLTLAEIVVRIRRRRFREVS